MAVKTTLKKLVSLQAIQKLLILFLGLNIAWVELTVDVIMISDANHMLGWPPLGLYMTALDWFWIHFVLVIISVAALIYTYEIQNTRQPQ